MAERPLSVEHLTHRARNTSSSVNTFFFDDNSFVTGVFDLHELLGHNHVQHAMMDVISEMATKYGKDTTRWAKAQDAMLELCRTYTEQVFLRAARYPKYGRTNRERRFTEYLADYPFFMEMLTRRYFYWLSRHVCNGCSWVLVHEPGARRREGFRIRCTSYDEAIIIADHADLLPRSRVVDRDIDRRYSTDSPKQIKCSSRVSVEALTPGEYAQWSRERRQDDPDLTDFPDLDLSDGLYSRIFADFPDSAHRIGIELSDDSVPLFLSR